MIAFLEAGEPALQLARAALAAAAPPRCCRSSQVTLQAPIPRPGKLLCMGHNYRDHSATAPGELPVDPNLFLKASSCVIGPGPAGGDPACQLRDRLRRRILLCDRPARVAGFRGGGDELCGRLYPA